MVLDPPYREEPYAVFPRWEDFLPSMGMFDSQGGNSFGGIVSVAYRSITYEYSATEAGY